MNVFLFKKDNIRNWPKKCPVRLEKKHIYHDFDTNFLQFYNTLYHKVKKALCYFQPNSITLKKNHDLGSLIFLLWKRAIRI